MEKAIATHSSTLALKIPWMEEPGRLHSRGVTKSQTWLSDFTFTFQFHALEKEMATHSSVLAWRIPGMGKPGGLPSMGFHRVGHDWSDLAAAAAFPSILVHWFLRCWCLILPSVAWLHQFIVIPGSNNIPGSYAVLFFTASKFTFSNRHRHDNIISALAQLLHSFWRC